LTGLATPLIQDSSMVFLPLFILRWKISFFRV